MPLSLNIGNLFSRTVRSRIGARTLGSNPMQTVLQGGKQIVRHNIGGSFRGFLVGFVLSSIPSLTWSLSGLWELFTSATLELYYFDWNIPDDTLDQQAKAQWGAYGGVLGGTAGSAIGFFACGVVPSSSIMAFNEDLGRYVLKEVGEEAFEEVTANFSLALRMAVRNMGQQTFGWLYKGARRWLKDPNNPVGNLIFGDRADEVRATWGEANAPSWSFAQAVDEKVEQIPSQFWQNFTEELIDEAIDSCIEAGYVLTSSIESYWARQREARALGEPAQRVIEVTPNRDNEREKIVLAGPEPDVRAQLPAVLAHHQLIEARDIGQIVGQPLDDYVRPRPFQGLRLQFKLYSVPSPPYSRRGSETLTEVNVSLSSVLRTKLEWELFRQVCGGPNGYLWGRWRAHAILDDGHSLTVYGGSKSEAEDRLRAFLTLTDNTIETLSVTEELKEGKRLENPKLYKETKRVYPAYATIINRERTLAADRGHRSRDGNYIEKKARIDLWRGVKPPDFEAIVTELLRRSEM